MAYSFDAISAIDPDNPERVASNASITIFAPGDTAMTLIAITDTSGVPLENPITVNDLGFGPAFMADIDRVAWEGGGLTGFFTSYEGLKNEAVAARSAAQTSALDANDAKLAAEQAAQDAASAGSGLPLAGDTGQVLAKASPADRDVTWIDPPESSSGIGPGDTTFIKKNDEIPTIGLDPAYRTINLGYLTDPNSSPDLERVIVQGIITAWRNEWGALRGTPSLGLKDDALVRGVARDDLGPTSAGGFIELVNRTFPLGDNRRQSFQVRWRDGALMRNNAEMSLCYVRYGAAALPANLPEGTVVVTVND